MADILAPHFQDANKAREYLEALRWPNGPICPHCGSIEKHYKLQGVSTRPGLWKCKDCRKQFSVTVNTVFADSKIPLNKWLLVVHLMCASKKAVSAHQIHRMLGITYKTAWFMCHRVREAMKSGGARLLGNDGGAVEVDETYWGQKKGSEKPRGGYRHKMKILSLVERDGEKRSFHVQRVNANTLRPILKANIAQNAALNTDELAAYSPIGKDFRKHNVVTHVQGEYVRGDAHTNMVECSFSLLKRGLIGTYHHVGEQHLQRYVTEFDYRWNHRKVSDKERSDALLQQLSGKRLVYQTNA
jgi:transposase-like protein